MAFDTLLSLCTELGFQVRTSALPRSTLGNIMVSICEMLKMLPVAEAAGRVIQGERQVWPPQGWAPREGSSLVERRSFGAGVQMGASEGGRALQLRAGMWCQL